MEESLPELYWKTVGHRIDEKGVYPHHVFWRLEDNKLCMAAVMITDPNKVLQTIFTVLLEHKPKELIYSMDRYCKSGQGTAFGDCLAGAYWNGELWRQFVIEYQHEPRIVKPLAWDNKWWNKAIRSEIDGFCQSAFLRSKP